MKEFEEELFHSIDLAICGTVYGYYGVFAKRDLGIGRLKLHGYLHNSSYFANSVESIITHPNKTKNYTQLRNDVAGLDGPAYFLNHSCHPNCMFKKKKSKEGLWSYEAYLLRPIKAGEEVTISYGMAYFQSKNLECNCPYC